MKWLDIASWAGSADVVSWPARERAAVKIRRALSIPTCSTLYVEIVIRGRGQVIVEHRTPAIPQGLSGSVADLREADFARVLSDY